MRSTSEKYRRCTYNVQVDYPETFRRCNEVTHPYVSNKYIRGQPVNSKVKKKDNRSEVTLHRKHKKVRNRKPI